MGKTISFRPVTMKDDLLRLHAWHQEPHVVPFWQLNLPLDAYRSHLERFLADTHHTLCMGELDGVPMSYFESYWSESDIIGRYYDVEEGDQGVHLLIGPPEYLGQGYAQPLLMALMRVQFLHEETRRIVAEPDIRNAKMRHIFEKCGFRFQREVHLPDKTAALMLCERETFEALDREREKTNVEV
ncbi:GNAT family N-acetyltransferase [Paenibacillus vietnamensis]|uniref:GNAT family N-acetyltransferase n=1 Tax=Paenibacillus vietnamensis TaxID=2590547 RepID=UPI0029641A91|nr:GNAT family N-acetyltransferase [Paenibacillus vietnamensis]